ncbi:hypothetical protein [Streptomyces hiroshimensis]|uniref:Aromatic ring-opening dioxygenase LigA n=1 Tax=Streptomyces hiroshimensis TaxID=66424 RepID=A0ABQ2YTD1_9ACTN|nr:hypothetical protein [Streptomyces hiroshimensis]GGX94696.1 hypothetical protein GCM10010324_45680 [Streptomyces hiroshimensis]
MTSTTTTVPDDHATKRRVLRAVAITACLPYLGLKVAWVAGSHVGIPEGSTLRDAGTGLVVANAITILMDATVVALALLLTRPWGRRVPAWLLTLPMWGAVGLLTPIMYGFPAQLTVRALGGSAAAGSGSGAEKPFLDEWVFGVVYTGFIVQGLALGTLFVLYARERWGHLWRGSVRDLTVRPLGRGQRAALATAGALAVLPGGVHLMWTCGVSAGLTPEIARMDRGDFAAGESGYVLYAAATIAGAVLLLSGRALSGRGGRLPLRVPLLLAGVGSAATAAWGGWQLLATLTSLADDGRGPTATMAVAYAVQVIIGLLVLAAGARFFVQRSARAAAL